MRRRDDGGARAATPPGTWRAPSETERRYSDAYGVEWRVREVDASDLRSPRGAWCLLFESEYASRRVWNYPADWSVLTDDALEKLSWSR